MCIQDASTEWYMIGMTIVQGIREKHMATVVTFMNALPLTGHRDKTRCKHLELILSLKHTFLYTGMVKGLSQALTS